MNFNQKLACRDLRATRNADVTVLPHDEGNQDFASQILAKRAKNEQTPYVDTRFILPTSNILERFFSCAGTAASDLRLRLSPVNLEEQLYLKINHRFWDLKTVNELLN